MANLDAPFGLRPAKSEYGTAPKMEEFAVKASVEIFEGQIVCVDATGEVLDFTTTLADAGDVIGVASNYVSAAATRRKCFVYVDTNQLYEMQSDDATAIVNGRLYQILTPNAGNATTLQSISEIDGSTGTSALGTGPVGLRHIRVEDSSKNVKNEAGLNRRYLVRIIAPIMVRAMGGRAGFTGI